MMTFEQWMAKHSICPRTKELKECWDAAQAALLQAIDDEPELPGDMPDEMWQAIRSDKDVATEAMRIVVRETKKGIRERLVAEQPGELPR